MPSAGGLGRADDAAVRPASLVGDAVLSSFPCGPPVGCPEALGFLDGIQRHQIVAYDGPSPLVLGWVAAGVLLRTGRELKPTMAGTAQLAIGRETVLAKAADALHGFEVLPLEPPDDLHPAHDLDVARGMVDRRRAQLEEEIGQRFRATSSAWLLIDGSLSHSTAWSQDPRMLGIAKSHAILPFDGRALTTYLQLPEGCRTSLFRPATRGGRETFSWGLRLREWMGKDPFHGLVRIEAAPTEETRRRASEYSQWILAERSPLSAPDVRWDRQLYGMRAVERYLGAILGE